MKYFFDLTRSQWHLTFYSLSLSSYLSWCHVIHGAAQHKYTKLGNHYYPAFIWCGRAESRAEQSSISWWQSYLDWSVLTWRMQNNWRNNDQLLTNTPEDSHNYLLSGVKQLTLRSPKQETRIYILRFLFIFQARKSSFRLDWWFVCQ